MKRWLENGDWITIMMEDDDGGAGGGGGDEAWYSGQDFSDEQVGTIQNKGWESMGDMFKSYTDLEKFKGADEKSLITIPKDGDAEGWSGVFDKLGRPGTAEEYVFDEAGITNEEDRTWLKEQMHGMGASSAKATGFYNDLVARTAEQDKAAMEKFTLERDAEKAALKTEWGGKYDERHELASRVLRAGGITQEQLDGIEDQLGYTPMIKLFASLGDKIGGDLVTTGEERHSDFGKTKEQLKADRKAHIQETQADPVRRELYNNCKGEDWAKAEKMKEIIWSMEK